MDKLYPIVIILFGEILSISAEIIAAKYYSLENHAFASTFLKLIPLFILGGVLLLCGYMLGLRAFKNIWIVSAVSITSILITEPVINYLVTHQLPTRGALIGLVFGALGFVAALFL